MDCSKLSRADAIQRLVAYIHKAQQGGCYEDHEGKLLHMALQYFDPNKSDDDRPKLTNDQRDQKAVALDLLKQGVKVAQRRGGAYNLDDAAIIFDLVQHINSKPEEEVVGSASSSSNKGKKKADSKLHKVEELQEPSEPEEEEDDVPQQRRRR